MVFSGRKPNKEEQEWLNKICELGCIICILEMGVYSPASPHHIDGKTKEGSHLKTIPLCGLHHQGGEHNEQYTSRHPYKDRFEKRYGTEESLLKKVREMVNESS